MKLKGIVLVVILLLASIMMPFDVYADTIDSHILGRNISYEFIQGDQYNGYAVNQSVFHVEIVLDGDYIGYMQPNFTLQYYNYFYGANPPAWNTISISFTNRVFVNGNTVNFDIPIKWNSLAIGQSQGGTSPYFYDSYTITSSDVTAYGELNSLEEIINILTDINNNIGIDVLQELETIVANTSLANDYLEAISKMKQWNIPFESLSIVSYYLTRSTFTLYDGYIDNSYVMNYPMFYIPKYTLAFSTYLNTGVSCLIMFVSEIKPSDLLTYFNNLNLSGFTYDIKTSNLGRGVNDYLTLYKITVTNNSNNQNFGIYTTGSFDTSKYIIPILCVNLPFNNISTDFALRFGLSNPLLDNIQTIANGTNQSNQAASDLESGNSQMADDMNDLATIENGYNQQFNNQLQQIDFTSPLQNNAGILPAANFVITIFNGLINNNPFSVLIIVVCILLIGKKVIGK